MMDDRIRNNIRKMIDQGAPEPDIDAYLATEEGSSTASPVDQSSLPPAVPQESGGFDFDSAFKTVDDIVRSLASGVTSGGADEFAGFMTNLTGVGGQGDSADYSSALEAERARDRDIPLGVRIPGEVAGMVAQSALTGGMAPAASLGGAMTRGGIQGALYGFGSGEGGLENRAESAAMAGGLGAAGGAVGHGISRMLQPRPTADVKALMQAGVKPTTGQILGSGAKVTEEKATSLPIVGTGIAKAQQRAIESFDVAAVNQAIKPAGLTVPKAITAGRDLIRWTGDSLSKSYDDVLDKMTASADDAFRADMAKLSELAQSELTQDLRQVFTKKLGNLFGLARSRNSTMSGSEAKEIISSLGALQGQFSRSEKVFEQNLGHLYGAAKNAFTEALKRSNPGQLASRLDGLDKAWANWVRIQTAAARTGSKEGIFTPAALNAAARQADKSVRKGAFAKGQALMQDFATKGENVLGRTYPDSGTAGRQLLPYLTGASAYGGMQYPGTTGAVLGGLGAARAAYTPTGQQLLAALLAGNRPQFMGPLAQGVSAAGPGAAALAPLLQGGN